MIDRFCFWKCNEFNPKVVYDIGSNRGEWTYAIQSVFTNAAFYLFEGCSDNNKYNTRVQNYHNVLLGSERKEVDFYCVKEDIGYTNTGNSMYLELSDVFSKDNFYSIKQKVIPLDEYIESHNIPYPDLIKIDVQGAELDVLEGGRKCLEHSTMVLLEVSIHRYNKNAPLMAEVIQYMDTHNFEPVDILETHMIKGYTAQIDILFAKKHSGYRIDSFYSK